MSTPVTGSSTTTPAARSRGPSRYPRHSHPEAAALIIHTRVSAVRIVPRPMSAAMRPVTIVTERAGRSRAAGPRRSGREPAGAHTSRAARTIRPVRTRPSGGRRRRRQPARLRTRATRGQVPSFRRRASVVAPVRTPRPARSRACRRRRARSGRAALDASRRRPSAGRSRL